MFLVLDSALPGGVVLGSTAGTVTLIEGLRYEVTGADIEAAGPALPAIDPN